MLALSFVPALAELGPAQPELVTTYFLTFNKTWFESNYDSYFKYKSLGLKITTGLYSIRWAPPLN